MYDDRRTHPRAELALRVGIRELGFPARDAVLRDLSLGGAFIVGTLPPAFGVGVQVEIELPGDDAPARLDGVVRWVGDGGFGVQFGPLRARHAWGLNRLLESVRASRSRPTLPPAAPC